MGSSSLGTTRTVHVLSNALHYGTGVFEGIRAYETEDGTAVFRLTEHIERLHRSARAYRVPLEWSVEELSEACKTVMRENGLEAGYIRPIVYYGLGAIGLNPTGATSHTAIAAWRWGAYLGEEGVLNGIRVGVSSWRRISSAAFVPVAKGCGQYLNSVQAKMEAISNGYDEALLLNSDGNISEGSGENVFVVRDGAVSDTPGVLGHPGWDHPPYGDDFADQGRDRTPRSHVDQGRSLQRR